MNFIEIIGFPGAGKTYLLKKIFGELGKHTRAAISTNSLPLGAAVEIDAIFEIK